MDMKKSLKRINVFLIFSLLISTVTVFYFFYNVTALMKEFKNTACSKEEA